MTQETDQYENICKDRFDKIEEIVTSIDTKLFRGNGSPSWGIRLDRAERILKVLVWAGARMTSTSACIVGKFIYDHLSH